LKLYSIEPYMVPA